jgi:DNA-binding NarL/FixJ family response regulator
MRTRSRPHDATVLRVVIGEDSVLLREGIARLLEDADFEVVAQAGDADELLSKVRAHKPDVAVIDIRMPPTQVDDGLRAAQVIRRELPEIGVLLLSQYVEQRYVMELLADGAEGVGYLLKGRVADIDGFTEAVRRVAGGGSALDPEVVAQMMGQNRSRLPISELSARESQVLARMAEGRTNHAISDDLSVSERAVERHVTSIFIKMGLQATTLDHRRVLAVLTYLHSQ